MTIYKFPLQLSSRQRVALPRGAEVLTVQYQHGSLFAWAMVDEAAAEELMTFLIFGTGEFLPVNPGQYLGTVQQNSGQFVWHVFLDGPAQ